MPIKKKSTAARPSKKRPSAKRPPSPSGHDLDAVIASLKRLGSARVRDDMANRYGIHLPDPSKAFGVPVAKIHQVAKQLGRSHELAQALWESGWYEARLLAAFVDEPEKVSSAQMDRWARDFDNWGVCDTVCFKLFDRVPPTLAFGKVEKWAARSDDFVKRAAFALLASLALHDKTSPDDPFLKCMPLIERAAGDDRNFVKKGVSWALRGIGKRGPALRAAATMLALRLAQSDETPCRWIGKDALRDLTRPDRKGPLSQPALNDAVSSPPSRRAPERVRPSSSLCGRSSCRDPARR